MTKPLKKDATYADLSAVPENFVAEILGGELYAFPRPASPHAYAAGRLFVKISNPFQDAENGPGGWWFLNEPELNFGADVVVPDIAGWRRGECRPCRTWRTSRWRPTGSARCFRPRRRPSIGARNWQSTRARASATCGS